MSDPVEIRVEKRFRHPRERVFDAFLDPAHVGEWLFHTPDGTMEKTDYDPRPGGTFAIFERRGADLARHFGRFVEIERPTRIVFDFWVDEAPDEPTRVVVAFESTGDGCVVVLTHDLAPAWADYAGRTTAGWTMILDSLAKVTDAAPGMPPGRPSMIAAAAPFLMFQGECEEALAFYARAIPGARVASLDRKPDGTVAMARLSVAGLEIMANDSPPVHDFDFTPSTSTFLTVDAPEAVDSLAAALGEGGRLLMPPDDYGFSPRFAWVQDRFGVSWQINAA